MKKTRLANTGNILAAMFNFGGKTVKGSPVQPVKDRVSEKGAARAAMPKYYGFRKRPVMAKDKNGVVKMVSLKTADKKGLEIVDTMGITKTFN